MIPSRSLLRLLTFSTLVALTQVAEVEVSAQVAGAQDASVDPADAAAIRAVRYHVEPGQTRVWFETTGAVLYTHYSPDPLTLVVDLPGVDISALGERTVVGSREVESIVAQSLPGANGKQLSRIEIKLAAIAPYQIAGSEHALNVVFDGSDAAGGAPSSTSPETLVAQTAASPVQTPPPGETPPRAERVTDETIKEEVLQREPAPAVAKTPPARPLSTHPASVLSSVTHDVDGDVLNVVLGADGRLSYTSFELDGPKRLVLDFKGVANAVPRAAYSINDLGVSRVRVAQFSASAPQITRVVFDLEEDLSYRTEEVNNGVEVNFARDGNTLAAAPAPPPSPATSTSTATALASIDDGATDSQASDTITITGTTESGGSYTLTQSASTVSEDGGAFEPVTLTAQDLTLGNPAPLLPAPPAQEPGPAQPAAGARTGGGSFLIPGTELGEREYTGELISLDFKDGDIQDIFRLFADISGLNIVVQPGVTGRITLKLVEVPWDQALELILKTNKLGYVVEGNVIRIAPLSELAQEEQDRRRLAEEKALAGELYTQTRILSYAKASDIEPLLSRNLSARGDIVIDERTNTVIYTDLAEQITAINALIDTLDTPIPGVEIEARIVVTTRTFSRQLGVQWGFTSNQTPTLGNTTELVFPNRIQLDGQAIGSDAQQQFNTPGSGGMAAPVFDEGGQTRQRGYAVNLPFAGSPTGAVGVSLGSITGAFSIDAALSAAERRGQVRIISAPKIITQNNTAAEIKQGVTFPVQVVANNTITVQFKDAVLELSVTPQITSSDTIILDIEVNNDSLDFGQAVNGIPSIITQAATTQVLVDNGSTTVIGGVFVNRQQTDEQYVPLLHRIPFLGYLFKSKGSQTRNEELLIFLTPRIRRDVA